MSGICAMRFSIDGPRRRLFWTTLGAKQLLAIEYFAIMKPDVTN